MTVGSQGLVGICGSMTGDIPVLPNDDDPTFEKILRHRRMRACDHEVYTYLQAWRMCGCKVGYPMRHMALRASAKAMEERGDKLRAYRCPICGLMHLTKKRRG